MDSDQIFTPWKVKGKVDYMALIRKFGTEPLDEKIIDRWEKITGTKVHHFIRRGLAFSHQDLNKILDAVEQGIPIYLYTGRGPSTGSMHLGHLIPFKLTKYLQDALNCIVVIQMSDDEKFFFKDGDLEMYRKLSYQNARDIIACGFDPNKTLIFSNFESNHGDLYKNNLLLMKSINMNTIKSIFGLGETLPRSIIDLLIRESKKETEKGIPDQNLLNDINSTLNKFSENSSNNVGQCVWPVFQSSPGFCTSFRTLFARAIHNTIKTKYQSMPANVAMNIKKCLKQLLSPDSEQSMLCLIPMAIDQAPYLRTCRDLGNSIKCPKPCGIFTEFLPGLKQSDDKMSSTSDSENSTIFLSMEPKKVEQVIKRHAFSGGKDTMQDHMMYGGNIEIDISYQYLTFFLESDLELKDIALRYTEGSMGSGEIKDIIAKIIAKEILAHQQAVSKIDDLTLKLFFSWDRTLDSGGLWEQRGQEFDKYKGDEQVKDQQRVKEEKQGINFDRTFGYKCKTKPNQIQSDNTIKCSTQ